MYDLDPLARTINVEASTYKVGRVKIELVLAKAQPGIKWKELDGTDEEANDTTVASTQCEDTSASRSLHVADKQLQRLQLHPPHMATLHLPRKRSTGMQ